MSYKTKTFLTGILFITPAVIVFTLFKYIPIIQAFKMSFYNWNIMNPPGDFIGLKNFSLIFSSTLFKTALKNNLIIFGLGLLFGFWVPILQAVFLNEIKRGQYFFRIFYLLPMAVPPMAGFILWKWIYHPDYGALNSLLVKFGLQPIGWLTDPKIAKISLTLPGLLGGGLGIFVYLSAIQGISPELFESAEIDGASPFQKFCFILLPRIKFVIIIQFILVLSGIFQLFDQIFVLTGGGPLDSTRVISMLIYRYAFENYQMGYASAIALIMFVLVLIATAIQMRLTKFSD